ncbi:MAG: hypothetical protein Kow0029_02510 [Candidatus Rifleibacteriota bacterium]
MKFGIIPALLCLMIYACPLAAVTPDISLPEWQKTEIGIPVWSPDEGLLVIKVCLTAKDVELYDVFCQLNQSFAPEQKTEIKRMEKIGAGEKVIFMFRFQVKPDLHAWIDLDLRARPNPEDLQKKAFGQNLPPLSAEILRNEINSIKKPILLGKPFPIYVSRDIAICATPQMIFKQKLEINGHKFYVWLPEENIGSGLTAETFKALRSAFDSKNYRSAAAACSLLIKRLGKEKEPLKFAPEKESSFSVPVRTAIEMLEADNALFSALASGNAEELLNYAARVKPSYASAFAYFNSAMMMKLKGKKDIARKWVERALVEVPAWPAAEALKKSVE